MVVDVALHEELRDVALAGRARIRMLSLELLCIGHVVDTVLEASLAA